MNLSATSDRLHRAPQGGQQPTRLLSRLVRYAGQGRGSWMDKGTGARARKDRASERASERQRAGRERGEEKLGSICRAKYRRTGRHARTRSARRPPPRPCTRSTPAAPRRPLRLSAALPPKEQQKGRPGQGPDSRRLQDAQVERQRICEVLKTRSALPLCDFDAAHLFGIWSEARNCRTRTNSLLLFVTIDKSQPIFVA